MAATNPADAALRSGAAKPRARRPLGRLLATRAAGDEHRAFEQIFRDHHQELYRYCLGILRNPSDAEDALQATMAAALRSLPGEKREIALRPWLFRVAHNEAISILRGRRPETEFEELVDGNAATAGEEIEVRDRLRGLVADLKRLPERQRGALLMRELSGLGFAEIAAALECSEGAARQTVYAARVALKTAEEGREMTCEQARRAISDGDRRRLRGRKLRAHLSSCDGCSDFRAGIEARRADLQLLCPPLPVAAAGGMMVALLGGGGKASAATGAGASGAALSAAGPGTGIGGVTALGGAAGTTVAAKTASVVAAAVLAAGVADAAGVVDLPGPINIGASTDGQKAAAQSGGSTAGGETENSAAGKPGSDRAKEARAKGVEASTLKGGNGKGNSKGKGNNGQKNSKGKPDSPGRSGSAPVAKPDSPGRSGTAPAGKPESPPAPAGGKPETAPPQPTTPPVGKPEAPTTPQGASGGGAQGAPGTAPQSKGASGDPAPTG